LVGFPETEGETKKERKNDLINLFLYYKDTVKSNISQGFLSLICLWFAIYI